MDKQRNLEGMVEISSDKVLTISAEEYFRMMDRNPSDYQARGVVFAYQDASILGKIFSDDDSEVIRKVPRGTEVVVSYQHFAVKSLFRIGMFGFGTALIPKWRWD